MATSNKATGMLARIIQTQNIPEGAGQTLRWVIALRYKVAAVLLFILLVSNQLGLFSTESTYTLAGVIILYAAITCAYDLASRGEASKRRIALLSNIQIPEKVLISTLAIYLSGGVLTPMVLLYPIAIIESIIVTNPAGVYRTGILSIGLYIGLAVLEAQRIIPLIRDNWQGRDYYEIATANTYIAYALVVSSLIMVTTYTGYHIAQLISQRNLQVRSRLQDLHTLYDIANGLGNHMTEAEMLNYLASTLKKLQNASSCVISMVDKEGYAHVKASAGLSPANLARLTKISVAKPSLLRVFRDGEPLIINDIDKQPEYRSLLANPDTRCAYLFPIKRENTVIGSISLAFDRAGCISEEYGSLLSTIAVQTEVALQRADLFTSTERQAREMSILYDIGLYTGSTLSRNEVIKRTSDTLEKLMHPDAYYIAMYDADTKMLSFEAFMEAGQQMPKIKAALDEGGLTGRIIESCKPLLVQDWLTDGQQYNALAIKTGVDMLSYLGVPMIAEDKVVGVISVQSVQPMAFDLHHERLLTALATQTGMALENARLHQVAQDRAKYDSLTGAFNHGMFVDLVRSAVAQSDCDDSCVALIMLDIDHFKKYNDAHGHVAGDNVLRMVANTLKGSVRETDAVGRWGGEEFCVLLPGAGVQEAKKIARYIRRAIAELRPVDGQGVLIPSPTVSQGISSYPYPSASAGDLIEEADQALYQAKERGRNRLVVYEERGVLIEATFTTGDLVHKVAPVKRTTTDNLKATSMPVPPSTAELITTSKLV